MIVLGLPVGTTFNESYVFRLDGTFATGSQLSLTNCQAMYGDGGVGPCVGTWQQSGDSVSMEVNRGYVRLQGTISGTRLTGSSRNLQGHERQFDMTKIS